MSCLSTPHRDASIAAVAFTQNPLFLLDPDNDALLRHRIGVKP
jgi:hypothetical protein